MLRGRRQKNPLKEALDLIDAAMEIAWRYDLEQGIRPRVESMDGLYQLRERLRQHCCAAEYLLRRQQMRAARAQASGGDHPCSGEEGG